MKPKVTVSTIPDADTARTYIEKRRWPEGIICPKCQAKFNRITIRAGGYYRCNACDLDFTVRTNTIFERSHIPLHKWLYVMYLLVTARKVISSLQLSKEIGITQKSAWFMMQRIREACGNDNTTLTDKLNSGDLGRFDWRCAMSSAIKVFEKMLLKILSAGPHKKKTKKKVVK